MPRHIDRPLDDPPHLDYRTLPGQSSVPLEPRVSGNFIPRKRLSNPNASFDSWEGQVTHAYLSRKKEQEAGRPYDTVSESKKLAGFIKRAGKVYLDLTSHQQKTFAAIEREAERLKKQQELEKKLAARRQSGRVGDETRVKKYTR